MEKHVFFRRDRIHPVALAILGWLAFVLGQTFDSTGPRLMLLSAARVLP
jgi:hypothetical protein